MQFEQEIKAQAQEANADKVQIESQIKELNAQRKIFMSEAKAQKATLELVGAKLIDNIQDVTEPLEQQLAQQTQEVETGEVNETGEPETIIVQDPAMQELLQNIAAMNQEATQQMAETVAASLESITHAMNAPRKIQFDDAGNPIGSIVE